MLLDNGVAEIRSRIEKIENINWKALTVLQQGDFKQLSTANYKKLRTSLLQNDFIQAFYVWENPNDELTYLLDGYHRIKVLEDLEREGYLVPAHFPAVFISCSDVEEAASFILTYSSRYATVTLEGMDAFMNQFSVDIAKIAETIDIPDINLAYFKDPAGYDGDSAGSNDINVVEDFTTGVNFTIRCETITELEELKEKLATKANKISYQNFLELAGI